jgi:exonuclease SbcD
MKIIHTGDWHIGKVVNEISMIEDQRYILNQLIKILVEEKPNVLVISGDLYDRSVPPAAAVELLDEYLNKILLELNVPIIAISGNHDSPERLSFGNKILKSQGFYIEGIFKKEISKVTLKDDFGDVDFYLVPYADPAVVRIVYGDENIRTHDDAMKAIIEEIDKVKDNRKRNVLVTHGYVTFIDKSNEVSILKEVAIDESGNSFRAGLEISESERPLSIGGTDLVSGKYFKDFNYVALGHLHGAQRVGSDRIRYAGSLLKYSFSEEKQKKSVTIVELDKDGEVKIELKRLNALRDMRTIKGKLNDLVAPEFYSKSNKEDYIFALLCDEGELIEPMIKLRAVYPNIMGLRKELRKTLQEDKNSLKHNYKNKSKLELFKEFYENITLRDFDENKKEIIEEILQKLGEKGE